MYGSEANMFAKTKATTKALVTRESKADVILQNLKANVTQLTREMQTKKFKQQNEIVPNENKACTKDFKYGHVQHNTRYGDSNDTNQNLHVSD